MTSIVKIIKDHGPILSGDIIRMLQKSNPSLTDEAARKRLSRIHHDEIFRISGLFQKNQMLFHHKDIFGTESYFDGIRSAFKKAGKQYNYIVQSLDYHYGHVKSDQLANYSVNPVKNLKGHINFETAKGNLIKLKLISDDGDYTILNPSLSEFDFNSRRSKGLDVAKNFLLVQFNDWSRKIGLTSYNASKFNSKFGHFQFHYVAPTYIGTLTKFKKDKINPGFIVADILIGNSITERQVKFFIEKIRVLKSLKNISHFIPMVIVDSMDTKALDSLKSKGIIIGFVNQIFGDEYKDLLKSLINLVANAGAILKKNPDEYLNIITSLNKLVEGKTHNLRGDLFELAVGFYQAQFCQSIEIGKIIRHDGQQKEIDVWAVKQNELHIIECKGYNRPISKDEINDWLSNTIPTIRKWVLSQASISNRSLYFEYWATGGFDKDAIELLDKMKKTISPTKYRIEYYDLDEMLNLSKNIQSKKFSEVLQNYYQKEIN